ncbi:MAG: TIGR03084 family metal-binding protein [Paracoccaceae bacterium]
MTLSQAEDFQAESETLYHAIEALDDAGLRRVTQFKGWTIEDVLVHLYFWNIAADLSVKDEAAFHDMVGRAFKALNETGSLRDVESAQIDRRGISLRDAWIEQVRDMAGRWVCLNPKTRLPWVGPSMSARSSMTARQMETWAHGMEIFDALGVAREEQDRVLNIVILGVNTFGWSHKVHGLDVPATMPHLCLLAPSGEIWEFGEKGAGGISGAAVDFAAVVTQTRALADTALEVEGDVAITWMANAQCFAGPPETPPAKGSRARQEL